MKKILALLLLLLLFSCSRSIEEKPLTLPEAKEVKEITIQWTARSYEHVVKSKEGIEKVLEQLKTSRKTKEESVNDHPNYYTLSFRIKGKSDMVYYFYEKKGQKYIEKPYEGIWETDKDLAQLADELLKAKE